MSPTATIASVVVALLFIAWLFQSDVKDPGYEAWVKRQQEEMKQEKAQKASMGINVTDAGVTKDNSPLEAHRRDLKGGYAGGEGDIVLRGSDGIPITEPVPGEVTIDQLRKDDPADQEPNQNGFGKGVKLNGTYVGVTYVGDAPKKTDDYDAPSITFRRDGGFTTQNMGAAEVDMEAGGTGGAVDRGSGRYRLWENTLELTFTDGLTRKKGSKRSYTVLPVSGPSGAPTAITIQGKIFKLDPGR
jgi:hypothetical protein